VGAEFNEFALFREPFFLGIHIEESQETLYILVTRETG
jgi:hypothetical protein